MSGWTGSGNRNFDCGTIILPINLGNTTGWYGFGVHADAAPTDAAGRFALGAPRPGLDRRGCVSNAAWFGEVDVAVGTAHESVVIRLRG